MLHFLSVLRSPSLSIPVLLCLELLPVRNVFCQHMGPLPTWGDFTLDFQFGDFQVTQVVGILVAKVHLLACDSKTSPPLPKVPRQHVADLIRRPGLCLGAHPWMLLTDQVGPPNSGRGPQTNTVPALPSRVQSCLCIILFVFLYPQLYQVLKR